MTRRIRGQRATSVFLSLCVLVFIALSFIGPRHFTSFSTSTFQFAAIESKIDHLTTIHAKSSFYDVIDIVKNKHCHRPCHPSIRNRIVYACLHPAGLLDREELLDNLLEISAFLCATLEFPTPTASFHPMHNHNRKVDPSLDWTDFFHYSLVGSESSEPIETPADGNRPLVRSVNVRMDPSFYLPSNSKPQCRRPRSALDRKRENYGIHIVSKTREDVLNDFDAIRNFSFGQFKYTSGNNHSFPFLWEIPTNYYTFHKELRTHLRRLPKNVSDLGSSCIPWTRVGRYVQRQFPARVQTLIEDVWNLVVATTEGNEGLSSLFSHSLTDGTSPSPSPTAFKFQPLIGFLHIRRGDTLDECDTSISKLKSYLSCSLSNMTFSMAANDPQSFSVSVHKQQNLKLNNTLLVGTNEENPGYMHDLREMVHRLSVSSHISGHQVDWKVRMIDMESLIWDHLRSEVLSRRLPSSYLNNFHVFQILEHIMNHLVDFKLVQRRFRYCNPSDKIIIRERPVR